MDIFGPSPESELTKTIKPQSESSEKFTVVIKVRLFIYTLHFTPTSKNA